MSEEFKSPYPWKEDSQKKGGYTIPGCYWPFDAQEREVKKEADGVWRMEKTPSDRLQVRVVIEITGKLRRADLDRFTQAMSKTVSFEFEDGGGGM